MPIVTNKKECVKHYLTLATTQELLEELNNRYLAFIFIYEQLNATGNDTSLGWAWAKSFSSLMGLLDYGHMRSQRIADEHISQQVNFGDRNDS